MKMRRTLRLTSRMPKQAQRADQHSWLAWRQRPVSLGSRSCATSAAAEKAGRGELSLYNLCLPVLPCPEASQPSHGCLWLLPAPEFQSMCLLCHGPLLLCRLVGTRGLLIQRLIFLLRAIGYRRVLPGLSPRLPMYSYLRVCQLDMSCNSFSTLAVMRSCCATARGARWRCTSTAAGRRRSPRATGSATAARQGSPRRRTCACCAPSPGAPCGGWGAPVL